MALATPVITTRVGGPLEIVDEPNTGLLVPPNDSSALARAIEALANDRQLRLSMGHAGRQRFMIRYTAREMARETVKLYRKLIDQSPVRQTAAVHSLAS
jgi:glycosyltransferase involved in cell wall biosynthesis